MNRKRFLHSILPLGIPFMSKARQNMLVRDFDGDPDEHPVVPPYLKQGDTIGITCPAGYISLSDIQPAIRKMEEWGFKVRLGSVIGKKDFTFGGTDDERRLDFQQMLDDPGIRAIMPARGGYGAIRIIDLLDFSLFAKHPKWIIGFSDITVMHSHINRHQHVATLHSKMCNSFPAVWEQADVIQKETIDYIGQCLSGKKMQYTFPSNQMNITGTTSGRLIGGNLKTIESLSGSQSDMFTKDKILFLEDTGEYLYSIDRMFWNLKRSGKLSHLKGLVIGGFKVKKDDAGEEFGLSVEQIVLEKTREYGYPVCFDFPVGHQKNNYPLKCGVLHRLEVANGMCRLMEE